jgi:glutamyl/glutaminyl-tRNA synthetase
VTKRSSLFESLLGASNYTGRKMTYRGRIAPSPTGLLHLGHALTFWAAYQRSIAASGTLVLRMEDLDPQRSKAEFAEAAIEDLRWLGIRWQEGPDVGGRYAPYVQSARHSIYLDALQRLIATGFVYPCRCSRKDLAQLAQAPHDDEPVYPGTCRRDSGTAPFGYVENPAQAFMNWRFRVPDGEAIEFSDGNFGSQLFAAGEDFGDFLVWRKDGVPAYQLAVAVDDAAMAITEVVRGADLLKSTARQILVCRALGMPEPAWFHCPLITDERGHRLAKRHDALSLRVLRASGTKPEDVLRMAAAGSEAPVSHRGPDL